MWAQGVKRLDVLLAARSDARAKAAQTHQDVRVGSAAPIETLARATYWHNGRSHSRTLGDRRSAEAYLADTRAKIDKGTWSSPEAGRITVGDLGRQWLKSNPSKRRSTREHDEAILRLHIDPVLGKTQVRAVTKAKIQNLVNDWASRQSPRTVQRQYDVLRAVFAFAVDNELIERSPCRGIREPETPANTRPRLTVDDVEAIARALPDEYRPMVYLGAWLGLRWAEVAGLRVASINLARSLVTVSQQLDRDGSFGPPKSGAGTRTLAMPAELTDALRAHLDTLGLTDPDTLVFSSPRGGPIGYSNWRTRVWPQAVRAAGLEGVTFHDLRRMAATLLVRLGVDVKTAQARLGHSDPRLTLAVYAQATSEGDEDAARRLSEAVRRSSNTLGTHAR